MTDEAEALLAQAFANDVAPGELAFLRSLPPARAETALRRLEALLADENGQAPLVELARRAGMARQNLFELRRRWREDRSIRSLTPYASSPTRGAVDRGGSKAAKPVVERLVGETSDYVAAGEIARRVVRETGRVDLRTALRLVRRERHAASLVPGYLARNYGRTVLVDVCALDLPLAPGDGLAICAFVMDRASLYVLGAAVGTGGEMADLQANALRRAIGSLTGSMLDVAPENVDTVVELVVADGHEVDAGLVAALAERPGFDVADEGPRRFGRRVAGLLDYRLGDLRLVPGFTAAVDSAGAGMLTKRPGMALDAAIELVARSVERHNDARFRTLMKARAEGLELVRQGVIGAALEDVARALSVRV